MNWIDVTSAADLAPGEWKTVDVDGWLVAVFNLEGELFALEDVCTHDGGELTGGEIEDGCIVCPRHGARFDIRTGAVLSPPAYEDILTFPVRIEQGRIEVGDEPR
jgi:3-phenylpropionate/trans-cinnamate dioxygenase ferredoxin subunit